MINIAQTARTEKRYSLLNTTSVELKCVGRADNFDVSR